MSFEDIKLRRVDCIDDLLDVRAWLGERRPILAVDTETGGLNVGTDALRLFQIGDGTGGWALDWSDWKGACIEMMSVYNEPVVFHNSLFDMKFLRREGLSFPQHLVHDTLPMCWLKSPIGPVRLKAAAVRYVDRRAAAGQGLLEEVMAKNNWDWPTVPTDCPAYWCVPESTEILTRTGWKRHEHLVDGDETLGYTDGHLEWTEITGLQTFDDAPVVRLGNHDWGTRCTPQHRWVIETSDGVKPRPLDEAWHRNDRDPPKLVMSAPHTGGDSEISPDEAAVMAWILSDGTISWQRPDTQTSPIVSISQSVNKFADEIRDLLKNAGAYVSEGIRRPANPQTSEIVRFYVSASYFQRVWDSYFRDRNLIEIVMSLSPESLASWTNAWRKAEGTVKTELHTVTQNEGEKLDALALAGYLSGFFTSVKITDGVGKVRFRRRQPTPQKTTVTPAGSERVWCPVTGLGTWTARDEEGNIFLTGNTYGVLDTCLTALLAEKLYPEIKQSYHYAYELELAVIHCLVGAELTGLLVDEDARLRTEAKLRQELDQLRAFEIPSELEKPTSDQQVIKYLRGIGAGEHLIFKTDKNNTSVDKHALAYVAKQGYEVAAKIAAFRSRTTTLNNYVMKFADSYMGGLASDHVLRCNTHPIQARTGRMSITEPPLQTLPRGRVVRDCIIARPGTRFVMADFAGMEMRVMASLSQDEGLLGAFARGEDPHGFTADQVYGTGWTKQQRSTAKNGNFCMIYGGGTEKVAETAGIDLETAAAFMQRHKELFPDVHAYMDTMIDQVRETAGRGKWGYVELQDGRRLPVEKDKAYAATNYRIQGGCAVTLKERIVAMDNAGMGDFFRLPVHDEVLYEVPHEHVREARHIVDSTMPDHSWPGLILEIDRDEQSRWGGHYAADFPSYIETELEEWECVSSA